MWQENIITDEKLVLKAAQAIWAMNKYLVLACSQKDYQQIRKLLQAENRDLSAVYNILENIETTYGHIPTEELPQLSNALYHIAGYFKKLVSNEERQEINYLIQTNASQALTILKENTRKYQVRYLLHSRFWTHDRTKPFNLIPIAMNHHNITYKANELVWHGDYLSIYN
ncbi:DUF1722 domain-containing protein [Allobacillus sp. GCM10007491]|uniref:DUF1722 domain-containing protein n=2 Tax=Allobacillus TaxID=1400133 RepID=A0A941HUC7_9BACI|nr:MULTISPECIES: DUF1722 domain-containing protein [Allobacillus]MBR7554797.1 DUF1722 domain-containing protein [Allobacillus saliphilus]TSJ65845.1 DUF1722 domain-containing protein [Allobacillus salarius]